MKINWMSVGIGFITTIILTVILSYVGLSILGPLIGGLIAAYMITGTYTDGAINGGLGACIAGFIYTLVVVLLGAPAISAAMVSDGYTSGDVGLIAIIGAIVSLVIFFILGAIGGIIGILIKGKSTPEATA